MIFRIALRNVIRHWYRYLLVIATLILGFGILIGLLGGTGGLARALGQKAARYFPGYVAIGELSRSHDYIIRHSEGIDTAIDKIKPLIAASYRRTLYHAGTATLNHSGKSHSLRRLVGLDWSNPDSAVPGFDFVEGDFQSMGSGGIAVSLTMAKKAGIGVGDDVLVLFNTIHGSRNILELKIRAIFRESSIFSYAAYMDIDDLNLGMEIPAGAATEYALFPANGVDPELLAVELRKVLAVEGAVAPKVANHRDWVESMLQQELDWQYAVHGQSYYLGQLQEILSALQVVSWILSLIMLGVIMIGIINTYRMVVRERLKEIGLMRAMGMQRGGVVRIFLAEALVLAVVGAVPGLLLGMMILFVLTAIDFSWYSILELFLVRGHLISHLSPLTCLLSLGILFVSVLIGALFPSLRGAAIKPVDTLRMDS